MGADGSGGEVLGEHSSHMTVVTVAGDDLAPDGLVVGSSLCVLGSVDVGDTLSMVENA